MFFMTIRKKFWCAQRLVALKNEQKRNDNSNNFGLLCATVLFFPLSVRIMALLYNAILWEILHIPLPKYGLSGVVVD